METGDCVAKPANPAKADILTSSLPSSVPRVSGLVMVSVPVSFERVFWFLGVSGEREGE